MPMKKITWPEESREQFPDDHWLEGEYRTRFNWPLALVIAFCLGFWLTVGVVAAKASYTDSTLNDVATKIAGHPVTVSCASGVTEWAATTKNAGYTFDVDGFTYVGGAPILYLAPRICDVLEADLHVGPTKTGDWFNGLAIKVLLHEASHQAGLADEHAAECNALALLKTYAPRFGYTPTITRVSYVKVRDGHYKRVTKVVPNPALASLQAAAEFWHRSLPAPYSAAC